MSAPEPTPGLVEALLVERAGYVARGLTARVALVDAQLEHYGARVPAESVIETAVPSGAGREHAVPRSKTGR